MEVIYAKKVLKECTVVCLANFLNSSLGNVRALLNHKKFRLVNDKVRDFNLLERIMMSDTMSSFI